MQTAIIFRNIDNTTVSYSTTPNKTSHTVLVVAIPDVLPLHVTHEGHLAIYVGKEKHKLDDCLRANNTNHPEVYWVEESGTYRLPLTITWDADMTH